MSSHSTHSPTGLRTHRDADILNSKSSTLEQPLQLTEGRDQGGREVMCGINFPGVSTSANKPQTVFSQFIEQIHVLFRFWPAEERVLAAGDRACAAARAATLRSTLSGVPSVPELLVTSFDNLLDL